MHFLNGVSSNAGWMAKPVVIGEFVIGAALALGLGLGLGLFTGIAAFLALGLNFSLVFPGSAGVNPAFIIAGCC